MEVPENRKWMYKRTCPGPGLRPLNPEFLKGVEEFMDYAYESPIYISEGSIRCPCVNCCSGKLLKPDDVKLHLYKKGFKPDYWFWTDHGEVPPHPMSPRESIDENHVLGEENVVDRPQNMVDDATTNVPKPCTQANTRGPASKPLNKTFLKPDGGLGFVPSKPAATAIAKVIRSKYDHPWPSWGKIPKATRETWFKEFQDHVWWNSQHHYRMWKAYNSRSSKGLSDLLGKARKLNERPLWIKEGVWEDLCRQWGTCAYKEKCQQAKRNRASDPEKCVYTGGCISKATHALKLAKAGDRELAADENFHHVHLNKANNNPVTTNAKQAYGDFKAKKAAGPFEYSNQGREPAPQMKSQEPWVQTDGKMKKARVNELGSQASRSSSSSEESSSSSSSESSSYISSSASSNLAEHVINQVKEQLQQKMEDQIQQEIQQMKQEIDSKWKRRFEKYQRKQEERLGNLLKSHLSSTTTQLGNKITDKNKNEEDGDDQDMK